MASFFPFGPVFSFLDLPNGPLRYCGSGLCKLGGAFHFSCSDGGPMDGDLCLIGTGWGIFPTFLL